jgi:hypothetical protein
LTYHGAHQYAFRVNLRYVLCKHILCVEYFLQINFKYNNPTYNYDRIVFLILLHCTVT